jgi:hypothetical protein
MAKLWLDHSDGRYSVRELTDEEAAGRDHFDVVHLPDTVWEAYLRHCDRDAAWQTLWRSISNEQYMRRRVEELLPLEEADREIARLKEELARAERMARHFEGEWMLERGLSEHSYHTAEARDLNDYTCVFPQPGCDVEVLPPAWRERAREILAKYRADLALQGMWEQGCCCGREHQKLDEATAQQLRNAGFLVEHDSAPEHES